ncbi:MAG: twin-arginine translocase TatA/TatE family subunit [Microcoleaceae cyanobacterium]
MLGLGWPEAAVVLVVALIIFGPKKVPELGKTLGQALKGFREEVSGNSTATTPPESDQAD